jgi:hypothetical protein
MIDIKHVAAGALAFASALSLAQGTPGSSESNPVLPDVIQTQATGSQPFFRFFAPQSGLWFDPPPVYGYIIDLGGFEFSYSSVKAPSNFSDMLLFANGILVDADFDAGETHVFTFPARTFTILNISPAIDEQSPSLATAFPLLISFNGQPNEMTWYSVRQPVPETHTFALMLLGVGSLASFMAWRAPRRPPGLSRR